MTVHSLDGVDEEGQELQVAHRILSRAEQIHTSVRSQGPVVVLSAAVDSCEWLLMQKATQSVSAGHFFHHIHDQTVVVHR